MNRRPRGFWKERDTDWSKPNRVIAAEVGCRPDLVAQVRQLYAKNTTQKPRPVDWHSVNWALTDHRISILFGCCKHRVAKVRTQFGAGKPRRYEASQGSDPRQTRHRGESPRPHRGHHDSDAPEVPQGLQCPKP